MKKKFFILTALLVAMATIATAQPRSNGTPEERAKNQTERLVKLLNLTDEQTQKIQTVNLDLAKKTDEAFRNNSNDREAARGKMQEIDTERDKKYKEILTEDQFKTYQEDKAERAKQRGSRNR
jgi:Spy/CpxP family protein refolding chaperone